MDLGPLLTAHAFLRVQRPPELWEVDAEREPVIRLLGEMIVAALVRGTELADIGLLAADVEVAADGESPMPAGQFVSLTVSGRGDWRPEVHWRPDAATGSAAGTVLVSADLDAAARRAQVAYGYTRAHEDGGSVTVFLPRSAP